MASAYGDAASYCTGSDSRQIHHFYRQPQEEVVMCRVIDVVEYPDEGFAILSDTNGRFLAFRDSLELVDLPDDEGDLQVPVPLK